MANNFMKREVIVLDQAKRCNADTQPTSKCPNCVRRRWMHHSAAIAARR